MTQPVSDAALIPTHGLPAWAHAFEKRLASWLSVPLAFLVAAEMVILFAGVMARYVFHNPLIWSDELASILFLWLAMLGAVVAFHRSEHMRMTALVGQLTPPMRAFFDLLATVCALLFLLLLLPPAWEYAVEEDMIRTPAMDLPNSWHVAAMAVGFGLMALFAILKLAQSASWKATIAAMAIVLGLTLLMWSLQPVWQDLGNGNLIVFFVILVAAAVFSGVPIAFAFGLATLGYVMLATTTPEMIVVGRMGEGLSHLILLSVPLFVFLGQLIEMTGMAKAMVAFLASLLGHVKGGLHYVLVGGMYLVSGISGSKAADMAAIAPVLFPEMKQRGAKEGDLVALLSATGAQTETIPPSIVLITIGSVTGVSISALFAGGLLPGLVLAVTLMFVIRARYRHEDLSQVRRASATEIARTFWVALPALALPFIIRAAVVEGVATATEVSTIGIAYAMLAGLILYRQFNWKRLYPMLVETASLSGSILLIIGAATAMAWGLTQSGFSRSLTEAMKTLPGGGYTFMSVSVLAFIVLGSVLEGIPAIVLFGPLLFPVAQAVGIHEVHYAMVVILSMGLGLFAPPFGVGYYAACAIGRVNPDAGIRPIGAYLLALFIGLVLVAAVPWISTGFL
jgi:tripartite ATP-independent transporter DctM subunit